ncbi:MAG TPA: methyltransferase [Candidatus Acidoferrales bacterium]|nr:methyltransferase [Candidatus Acidoferrales bacterium]
MGEGVAKADREEGKNMDKRISIRRPRSDDRPLWDVFFALNGSIAVYAAHKLKIFSLLAERAHTLPELCEALKLAPRPAEALLSISAAAGFVELREGRYGLTPLAEDYLVESSTTYFGAHFELPIGNDSLFTIGSVEKAARTDSPQVYGGNDWMKSHEERAELARGFTRSMHSASMAPAFAWPEMVDLSSNRAMLDIGGGSGAHCIGAVTRWPRLKATVFDIAPVCEVASEIAAKNGVENKVGTHVGDIWSDPFPAADLHFYSMIYHDWPPDKCRFLTAKSFASLPSGGRIVIHEMLFNDDRTGPYAVAAFNIAMLLWVTGQQYSGRELTNMLVEAGFKNIEAKPTFGYWSVVTGVKP